MGSSNPRAMAEVMEILVQQISGLVNELRESRAGGGGRMNWSAISTRKGWLDLDRYSGKPNEWVDWKFKVMQFLEAEDSTFRKFLTWAEGTGENMTTSDLWEFGGAEATDEHLRRIEWFDQQLYSMMAQKCTGDALTLVRSVSDEQEAKGITVWKKLTKDQEGMNALRMSGIIKRVFEADRVTKYKDVVSAIEVWELRLKDFLKATGTTEFHDSLKVHAVCRIVPSELEKEVMKMPTQTYAAVKSYIYDQVAARKEPWFSGEKGSKGKDYGKDHQGQADMELDYAEAVAALDKVSNMFMTEGEAGGDEEEGVKEEGREGLEKRLETALMALRGRSDGHAGAKFPGNCHHCGKPGHRMSECWLKDEEMRRMRGEKGKGKGGAFGYQGGGKGGPYHGSWGKGGDKGWGKGGDKGWGKGSYTPNPGNKGGGKGYGKSGGKGGLNWFDGAGQAQGGDWGWQAQGPLQRQLFTMSKIEPPPGIMGKSRGRCRPPHEIIGKNRYACLDRVEEEEDEEFNLPEACEVCSLCTLEPTPKEVGAPKRGRKAMKRVKKVHWKPVTHYEEEGGARDGGHALSLTTEPVEEVHALSGTSWLYVDPTSKWRRVRSVMDSGASDNCGPPELAPEVPIEESPGSKRGQRYAAAGGKNIENLGEKTVQMTTDLGQEVLGTWQMAEVVRPLNSVKKICEKGNRVIFGSEGGVIQNLYTGEEIPFGVDGDIYTLDLWLPPAETGGSEHPGFSRPGWGN